VIGGNLEETLTYKEGSIYPHYSRLYESHGVEDLENKPVEEKYRKLVPKSKKVIKIGQVEKTPFGALKCFMRKNIAVVGLYKGKKVIGYELLYEPKQEEIKKGILEWKFDLQNTSVMGTDWDYQDTTTFFWTIKGLREKGAFETSKSMN
jgi:hypothetical protein